jgi:aminoglycoside 6'-N-acetyltransferase
MPPFALNPPLVGPRLTLREVEAADVDALVAIVNEPEVRPWWGGRDPERQIDEFDDGAAIVVDATVAGWLGVYEEEEPDYRHAALDIVLTTSLHDQRFGREALRMMIRHLIDRGHHRFTIDPSAANARAIRTYGAVGFKPVGLMREYERGPDLTWHDGLLMDLVVAEFVEADG